MSGSKNNNYAVIMAGGIGSRFWPVSKKDNPKQFIDILGIGKSLIQLTYERLNKLFPSENIFVVTNRDYKHLVQSHLPKLSDNQILIEPMAKNTAPCIAFATHKLLSINPDAVCLVAPSDHLILDETMFLENIKNSLVFVEKNEVLLTLGIKPSRPDTGYGYIQHFEVPAEEQFFKVKTFTEKPTYEIAKSFLESGDFLWNSGIFIWKASTINNAFERHLPEINGLFKQGAGAWNTINEEAFIDRIYPQCRNISIDYAVLEKDENVYVMPGEFGWSDLGTWKSLYENKTTNQEENVMIGENILVTEGKGNLVFSNQSKLIVMRGIDNAVVVDSGEVILIFTKEREQEIRDVVAVVKEKYKDKFN